MDAALSNPGKVLAILGTALQLGPIASLLNAFPGIDNAFRAVVHHGLGDPVTLLPAFAEIAGWAVVGLAIGAAGLILLTIALAGKGYRRPWFFWFLVSYGGLLVPVFPVGTGFGTFFLVYCLTRRQEFLPPAA